MADLKSCEPADIFTWQY